jgi:hypothetical protein
MAVTGIIESIGYFQSLTGADLFPEPFRGKSESDKGDCKYRSAHQRGYRAGYEENSKEETNHKEN